MHKIDKYIAQTIFAGILIVLVILVGLFTFFAFIEEVEDIGKQDYGIWDAALFVVLGIPRFFYDLFPTASLLGSLIGLGIMANHNELTIIRAAGVSIVRIAWSVLKVGLVLTAFAMLVGETVAPACDQYAKTSRALAKSEQQNLTFANRQGFWARDGNNFINIRLMLPDGGFGEVALYELDNELQLRSVIHAETAYYKEGYWLLEDVDKTLISTQQITHQPLAEITWNAILNPELVKIVMISPYKLSSLGLYYYVNYLKKIGQQSAPYELALWTRLSYPLVSMAMLCIAIPFIFGSLRNVAIGQRILTGTLLGIGFYIINQIFKYAGLVYGFNPIFSALMSPILFLLIALMLMRRAI